MWQLLAQSDQAAASAGLFAFLGAYLCCLGSIFLVFYVVVSLAFYKILMKAGKPGWPGFVPIYNMCMMEEVAGRPAWWGLLFLGGIIPVIGGLLVLAVAIVLALEIARKFDQGVGFAVGLILLPWIFYPILGFGKAQYNPAAPGLDLLREKKPPTP